DAAGADLLESPTHLLAVPVAEVLRREGDSLLHRISVVRVVLIRVGGVAVGVILAVVQRESPALVCGLVVLLVLILVGGSGGSGGSGSLLGFLLLLRLGALPSGLGLLLFRHAGTTGTALLRRLLLRRCREELLRPLDGVLGGRPASREHVHDRLDVGGVVDFDLDLHLSFLSNTSCGP